MERHTSSGEQDRHLPVEWFQGAWMPRVLFGSAGTGEGSLEFAGEDATLPLVVGEMLTLYRRGVVSYSGHAPLTRSIALPAEQSAKGNGNARSDSLRDDSITRIRI